MPVASDPPPREPSKRISNRGGPGRKRSGRGRRAAVVDEVSEGADNEVSQAISKRDGSDTNGDDEEMSKLQEPQLPKFPREEYTDIYPGLNDFGDALEAIPLEIVRHFTLLKEIDAKCTSTVPTLTKLVKEFLTVPVTADNVQKREDMLAQVRELLKELMPCLEEKMHVAGVAAEAMVRRMDRLEYDWELITQHEFPEELVYGNPDHMAFLPIPEDGKKSAQAARSESRREAIAAKKAAQAQAQQEQDGRPLSGRSAKGRPSTKDGGKNGPGRKPAAQNQQQNNYYNASGSGNESYGYGETVEGYSRNAPENNTYGQQNPYYEVQQTAPQSYEYEAKRRRTGDNIWEEDQSGARQVPRRAAGKNNRNKEDDEPVYCYCQQVSYGEMVGCDGPDCKREWFHLPCIGLMSPPKGQWFCEDCAAKYKRRDRARV